MYRKTLNGRVVLNKGTWSELCFRGPEWRIFSVNQTEEKQEKKYYVLHKVLQINEW